MESFGTSARLDEEAKTKKKLSTATFDFRRASLIYKRYCPLKAKRAPNRQVGNQSTTTNDFLKPDLDID